MRNGTSTVTLRQEFQCRLANSSDVNCQVGKANAEEHKQQAQTITPLLF